MAAVAKRIMRSWTLQLVLLLQLTLHLANGQGTNSSSTSAPLAFGPINFAGYDNHVFRDEVTSVQVVVSSNAIEAGQNPSLLSSYARFLLAFPRGNSGSVTYFQPTNGSLTVTALNETFRSYSGENNQTGFQGELQFSGDATFGETFIGSIRTVRDWVEGNKTRHEIFNYTLGPYNATSVSLIRNWINGTTVQYLNYTVSDNLNLTVTPNANATLPPEISLSRADPSRNGTLAFATSFNFTNTTELVGLGANDLFLSSAPEVSNGTSAQALGSVIEAIQGPGAYIANQTAFLSNADVFFAGGWRFLTYFGMLRPPLAFAASSNCLLTGRDTLLTLRLLLPVFTSEASEAIMRAVLERTRVEGVPGELCHEETIGDYASFVNIQNNQSNLGQTPSYNYVMLDTDFLLLPVLADYLLTTAQGSGRGEAFLSQESRLNPGTLRSLLQTNVDHVLNLTAPFASNQSASNLLMIRDPLVGNWRDSGTGLGYGKYPFDVNTAFVGAALTSIAALSDAGILPANYSEPARQAAEVWNTNAAAYFEVSIDAATAQSRLANYVTQSNLTEATIYGNGVLNGTASNATSSGNATIGGTAGGNSTFYAVSLLADGTPVEILNSDLGFVLEYNGNVSANVIRATIEALQPYPRGLLTNVGMVVASAAYDSNVTDIQTFSNIQYHGAVSWSWQQGIMAQGITRQLSLCGFTNNTVTSPPVNATRPSWCDDTELTSGLQAAQTRLWDSIAGSAPVLYTEVWSPVFDAQSNLFTIGDLGAISPTGTEGDAIQLWSFGFLGLLDPRTGRPVAAGF